MSRFLIFYFLFYGGAHAYFHRKLTNALRVGRKSGIRLIPPLALLFIAPLLARNLDRHGLDLAAEIASNVGYWWMGILFLFTVPSLLLDLTNILLKLLQRTVQSRIPTIPAGSAFVFAAVYATVVTLYGYHEARDIRIEHVTIKSGKVPAEVGRVRLVQISDLHAGQIVREKRIREIIRLVKSVSPDMVVSTGDLVDGHQRHINGLEKLFRDLTPRLEKYAVTGNHEFYIGLDRSIRFTEDAGFRLLMDQSVDIGNYLTVCGLIDPGTAELKLTRKIAEERLLDSADQGRFVLLLKHRPVLLKDSYGRFDLQLSGHVHKGQIFPFNIITWLEYPIHTGLTTLEKGSSIYVSRGTGVWGPPIRFLAPPEITVIDLVADHTQPK